MSEAFGMADKVLYEAVKGVSDLIHAQGQINVDFADVKTIMANKGMALMGVGFGAANTVQSKPPSAPSPALSSTM